MPAPVYDGRFYDGQSDLSRRSADKIVPLLIDLFKPRSVADIGCGVGTWCAAFEANGVPLVQGLDGPWVDKSKLQIRADRFVEFDFGSAPKPYRPKFASETFDLVVSFEVLEHIAAAHARDVVSMMTRLGDIVVCGAAIPLQGGRHHVNEQWPEYWRALFADQGFEAFDALRPLMAHFQDVDSAYVQNTILYTKAPMSEALRAKLNAAVLEALKRPASWVHPILFTKTKTKLERSSISRRLKSLFRGR